MLPSDFEYNTWQFKVWQLCNPLLERQSYPLNLRTTPDSLKSGSYVTPHKEDSLTLWLLSVTPDCLKSGNLIPPGSGLACKIKQPSSFKHSTCLESTHKGVISPRKTAHKQQQRPQSPTATLTWHASQYKVHKLHQRYSTCLLLFFCLHHYSEKNNDLWGVFLFNLLDFSWGRFFFFFMNISAKKTELQWSHDTQPTN